jgi:hypothetical protein
MALLNSITRLRHWELTATENADGYAESFPTSVGERGTNVRRRRSCPYSFAEVSGTFTRSAVPIRRTLSFRKTATRNADGLGEASVVVRPLSKDSGTATDCRICQRRALSRRASGRDLDSPESGHPAAGKNADRSECRGASDRSRHHLARPLSRLLAGSNCRVRFAVCANHDVHRRDHGGHLPNPNRRAFPVEEVLASGFGPQWPGAGPVVLP